MKVNCINHTPDPEKTVAIAARLCYSSKDISELDEDMTADSIERMITTLIQNGHMSPLEHASYTFAIEDVSRSLTHQLVRHRLASYSQQSQRYVKFDESIKTIEPKSISNDESAHSVFLQAVESCRLAYSALLDLEIPAEDARYVLPNSVESKIIMTMNCRELLHFFRLRCCNRAQWEIRELADKMLIIVKETTPLIFKDAGAPCVSGPCTEGKMSCGNPRN